MSDNLAITPGTGAKAATDEVTYSGDTAMVQLVRLVDVTGAEGSKTVTALVLPISATALPLPTGAASSANQTTGNGYLSAIATAVASTAPSPVEVGPFTPKEIAASQTNAVLGATGAAGDYLSHIILQPTSTSPGVVTLYDGSTGGTNVTVYSFPGGASSLSNLAPIIIGLAAKCANAGWHVTTGANVSVTAVGTFT